MEEKIKQEKGWRETCVCVGGGLGRLSRLGLSELGTWITDLNEVRERVKVTCGR